jgi:predicted PurR-regulated permease PerM
MLHCKAFMDTCVRIDARAPEALQPTISADHDRERALWELPVDVRSASMGLLAVLATLYTLHWAKDVFIPVLLGLMASYALTPLVDCLERWRQPRVLASALVLVAIVSSICLTSYRLSDDAGELIASLPEVAQKLRQTLQKTEPGQARTETTIDKVQQAATELEKTADGNATAPDGPRARGRHASTD